MWRYVKYFCWHLGMGMMEMGFERFFIFAESFFLDMNISGSGPNFNSLGSEQDSLVSG